MKKIRLSPAVLLIALLAGLQVASPAQEKPAGTLEQLPVGKANPLPSNTTILARKAADAFF